MKKPVISLFALVIAALLVLAVGCELPFPGGDDDTLSPGRSDRTIRVGGQNREYILVVPRSYTGNTPVPLVLDFHPLMMGASYEMNNSGMRDLAQKEGFIVAYPQGLNNAWNFGPCCTRSRTVDDVGFAMAIIDELSAQGNIDASRIYATGYSNGGGLSHYLACQEADTIAAVAPAAFDLVEEVPCNPSRPISVYMKRGRTDNIVPFNGGRSVPPTSYQLDPIHFLGADDTFAEWGEINGCSGTTNIGGGCQSYSNCDGGVDVVLCTDAGGHVAWDAEKSWDFLKTQRLP